MAHKFSNQFNWLSKHYRFILFVVSGINIIFFTFAVPILLQWVFVPVWLLILLFFVPFLIEKILRFYFKKSRFKKGDIVFIKGSSTPYFVIGFAFLNKTVLQIRHFEKEPIFYHQSFLEIQRF
jgi:hypothetical protein